MLVAVALYARKLALAFWIGEMLFFAAIFAPRVFRILPRPLAGELQAAIFPPYYTAAVICGLIVLATMFLAPASRPRVTGTLVLGATLIMAYSLWSITPRLTALQPELLGTLAAPADPALVDPLKRAEFDGLHKASVRANAGALLALLAALALL